jgi:hypothetical protein
MIGKCIDNLSKSDSNFECPSDQIRSAEGQQHVHGDSENDWHKVPQIIMREREMFARISAHD